MAKRDEKAIAENAFAGVLCYHFANTRALLFATTRDIIGHAYSPILALLLSAFHRRRRALADISGPDENTRARARPYTTLISPR